jgi:hypothetical protein
VKRLSGSYITKLRRAWAPRVEAGACTCPKCGQVIKPGEQWDLGHQHDLVLGGLPGGPMVPEHRACNRSAGARIGNATRRRTRRRLDEWIR